MMMADSLFEDGVGKFSRVLFSGKDKDSAYFQERFDARMYCLKLLDVMERRVTANKIEQKLREGTNQKDVTKQRRRLKV